MRGLFSRAVSPRVFRRGARCQPLSPGVTLAAFPRDSWVSGAAGNPLLRLLRRLRAGRAGLWIWAAAACACGGPVDVGGERRLAVLSAFPAELEPLVGRARIDKVAVIDGRKYRMGALAGVPVVLGLTGIGIANAQSASRALFARVSVAGVIVSGVAGSSGRIGEVAVPEAWMLEDGPAYPVDSQWLEAARALAVSGAVTLERCTRPPSIPGAPEVCLSHEPGIVVGGVGRSRDPFGGAPFPCRPGGGDVFGCDVEAIEATGFGLVRGSGFFGWARGAASAAGALAVEDMETAAIAREAASRSLRFIAFRAVSDGAGDPLGLPGYPAQFFAYYRLAAGNAAAAAMAFVESLAAQRL